MWTSRSEIEEKYCETLLLLLIKNQKKLEISAVFTIFNKHDKDKTEGGHHLNGAPLPLFI